MVQCFKKSRSMSNAHARVIDNSSCISCHTVHDANAAGVFKAIFQPSGPTSNGIENKCLNCHDLPLMKTSVHSSQNCGDCHSEHKGGLKPPNKPRIAMHTCRDKSLQRLPSHPSFGPTYPWARTAINSITLRIWIPILRINHKVRYRGQMYRLSWSQPHQTLLQ